MVQNTFIKTLCLSFLVLSLNSSFVSNAQTTTVLSQQKISDIEGNFAGVLDDSDRFGVSVANLGDLDGDGVNDLAVGADLDDDGGTNRGAVWILFMHSDGSVKSEQKISDTEGNFAGILDDNDFFGRVGQLGDFDGDGIEDLAVGSQLDDDGGSDRGALYLLLLDTDGTVKTHQKISNTSGGFTGGLNNGDRFGAAVTLLGDLDGNGVNDLAVGSYLDDDGGPDRGAVWILFLNTDGTVATQQKISDTAGGFTGSLDDNDHFGVSVTTLDDLDGDGVPDLAVGANADDDGGIDHGAAWILFLNADGTVKDNQKISSSQGDFNGALSEFGGFGAYLASTDDFDGDGTADLAVGAPNDDDGGLDRGAVWMLFLNTDGTVKSHQKFSDTEGGFTGGLVDRDEYSAPAFIGDLDGDGVGDLAVGARHDDDGGTNRGAVWVMFLDLEPVFPPSIANAVVFATNSVWLKQNSDIHSGNVLVNDASSGPFLSSGVELTVGLGSTTPSGYELKANRIKVKSNGVVNSDVYYNELNNSGTINGTLSSPVSLPLLNTLPPFKSAPAGTQDITVSVNDSIALAPGDYGNILVKSQGILYFTGGIYNINSIDAGLGSNVLFGASSEVRIADTFNSRTNSHIGPGVGSGIEARDIIFYVAGINGSSGALGATPKAAKVGLSSTFHANIFAPNGTIWLKNSTSAVGSFWAKDVLVGLSVQLSLDSYLSNGESVPSAKSPNIVDTIHDTPRAFTLEQNYPNPFNPVTTIRYSISKAAHIRIAVYDILGREIAVLVDRNQTAGNHEITFNAQNLPSGTYIYRIDTASRSLSRMMSILK